MGSPIIHVELSAKDHGKLADWYARHFGWKTQSFPAMDYTTANWTEGQPGAGFGPESPQRPIGTILCYIYTDDITKASAEIAADGGTLVSGVMEVPTVGSMLWFTDPDGNPMALLQPEMPSMAGEDA